MNGTKINHNMKFFIFPLIKPLKKNSVTMRFLFIEVYKNFYIFRKKAKINVK